MNNKRDLLSLNTAFAGVWIPREVILDESLSPMSKLLYSILIALDNGGCTASNAYLALVVGCSDRHIRGILEELESRDLISRSESESGRRIMTACTIAHSAKKAGTTVPGGAEVQFRVGRNPSSTNSKDNNKEDSILTLTLPFLSDEFKNAWTSWVNYRKQAKKPLTKIGSERQLELLKSWGEPNAIASIDASISSGWQGLFPPRNMRNVTIRKQLSSDDHKNF